MKQKSCQTDSSPHNFHPENPDLPAPVWSTLQVYDSSFQLLQTCFWKCAPQKNKNKSKSINNSKSKSKSNSNNNNNNNNNKKKKKKKRKRTEICREHSLSSIFSVWVESPLHPAVLQLLRHLVLPRKTYDAGDEGSCREDLWKLRKFGPPTSSFWGGSILTPLLTGEIFPPQLKPIWKRRPLLGVSPCQSWRSLNQPFDLTKLQVIYPSSSPDHMAMAGKSTFSTIGNAVHFLKMVEYSIAMLMYRRATVSGNDSFMEKNAYIIHVQIVGRFHFSCHTAQAILLEGPWNTCKKSMIPVWIRTIPYVGYIR